MDADTALYKHTQDSVESCHGQLTVPNNALQDRLLQGVSRTFALTIPVLPPGLRETVANGYLLCRIVDTIEDDPALNTEQKRHFANLFVQVVEGETSAEAFASDLAQLLSAASSPAEHELIKLTPEVIGITHSFNPRQREALSTCVRVMSEGMVHYQLQDTSAGLSNMAEMEKYCYYVAGVVGEMLSKLFCDYSTEIAVNQDKLMALSVHFGQGLQMTNILKDIWDDKQRGACWLPQSEFTEFDLASLRNGQKDQGFERGLERLVGIAYKQLQDAMDYTLLIPRNETGIRNFCLWALGMAALTLRKINHRKDFNDGNQVKISRRSVKLTVLASRIAVRHDFVLKLLLRVAAKGLPQVTPNSKI